MNRLMDLEVCDTFEQVDNALNKILGRRCNIQDKLDFMFEYTKINYHSVNYAKTEDKYNWIVNDFIGR